MITNILKDRPTKLFINFTAFFVANALIAECIGTKIFSLEKIFGITPANLTIFGQSGLSFNLTCGVLLWPLEFVMTDIVNEYYGPKAVRRISYTAVILISYAFLMFFRRIEKYKTANNYLFFIPFLILLNFILNQYGMKLITVTLSIIFCFSFLAHTFYIRVYGGVILLKAAKAN